MNAPPCPGTTWGLRSRWAASRSISPWMGEERGNGRLACGETREADGVACYVRLPPWPELPTPCERGWECDKSENDKSRSIQLMISRLISCTSSGLKRFGRVIKLWRPVSGKKKNSIESESSLNKLAHGSIFNSSRCQFALLASPLEMSSNNAVMIGCVCQQLRRGVRRRFYM